MMATETAQSRDEAQLRQLIAEQTSAICAKDLDRLMTHYAADAVVFDVKPPHRLPGPAAIRRVWEECLPHFPAKFKSEHHDLKFVVGAIAGG